MSSFIHCKYKYFHSLVYGQLKTGGKSSFFAVCRKRHA